MVGDEAQARRRVVCPRRAQDRPPGPTRSQGQTSRGHGTPRGTLPAAALEQLSLLRNPAPARQQSVQAPANRHPDPPAEYASRPGWLMAACSRKQPSANRRFTNAGSRDNATRNRPSAHGANGDTTGSRQTRFAPDWRRGAAACKRDGASSTHLLQRQPAYCREQDYRAKAPSIRTTYVRALRKLLHIEPTSYRYCRAQRCSCALGLLPWP